MSKGFPIGARVLLDGKYPATVKAFFPEGSTSYLFPHYKVREPGSSSDAAVQVSRVHGVMSKEG